MDKKFLLYRFFNSDDCYNCLGTIFNEDELIHLDHFTLKHLLLWHKKLHIPGSWKLDIVQNSKYFDDLEFACQPFLIASWYSSGFCPKLYWDGPIEIYVIFDNAADAALYKLLT